jgi:hypothetical protein
VIGSTSQPREAEKRGVNGGGGWDSPPVQNLPTSPTKVNSQGTSSFAIPPQGASSYSKPVEEGDPQVTIRVGRLHMAWITMSVNSKWMLKRAKESQSSIGGLQLGYMALAKTRDVPTKQVEV